MKHPIHRVTGFVVGSGHTIQVEFADGVRRVIDFEPVLAGELYGPLRDPEVFCGVRLDTEVGTLVWPNGADFDPATLHDWPNLVDELVVMARRWQDDAFKAAFPDFGTEHYWQEQIEALSLQLEKVQYLAPPHP